MMSFGSRRNGSFGRLKLWQKTQTISESAANRVAGEVIE
jgi:hypothetical protein